ncbi:hypothetical protein B0H13DRAFT_2281064 [Mycena leptocephala]|nr:hypothetical protein B0H13DRAFT_2281064 [Mycena leptocephala]
MAKVAKPCTGAERFATEGEDSSKPLSSTFGGIPRRRRSWRRVAKGGEGARVFQLRQEFHTLLGCWVVLPMCSRGGEGCEGRPIIRDDRGYRGCIQSVWGWLKMQESMEPLPLDGLLLRLLCTLRALLSWLGSVFVAEDHFGGGRKKLRKSRDFGPIWNGFVKLTKRSTTLHESVPLLGGFTHTQILTPLLKHPDPWLLLINLPARLQSLVSRVDATPILTTSSYSAQLLKQRLSRWSLNLTKNSGSLLENCASRYLGPDSVRGLCTGLPPINPRRIIILDGAIDEFGHKAKKNKQVTQLFETLLGIIPKWDKLHEINPNATLDTRAEALALALRKSQSLQTLVIRAGFTFPEYLRHCIRTVVNQDPKLAKFVTFSSQDDPPKREIPTPLPSSSQRSYVLIQDLQELKRVGETRGGSVEDLDICIGDLLVLIPRSLNLLQEVTLSSLVDVPASIVFLRCRGAKLLRLAAPLEIFMSVSIFDLCKSLNTAVVGHSHRKDSSERKTQRILLSSGPHTVLTKVDFEYFSERHYPLIEKMVQSESFPVLKEIQPFQLRQGFRKTKWIPLSELLHRKGIKLIDKNEVGETGVDAERYNPCLKPLKPMNCR